MTDLVTDETVEAVARTLHRLDHEDEYWETAPPRRRDMYTSDARAALTAAAPIIAAQATADLRAKIEALRDTLESMAGIDRDNREYDRTEALAEACSALDALLREGE